MVVPFKSLRYRPDRDQVWGIQIRRTVIRKNEWAYLTLIPISAAGFGGRGGVFRVSAAGTLVGLETPPAGTHLEIKPYAIGGMTTDVNAPPDQGARHGGLGVDLKYGVTRNLTADFTVNTDFAQVEVDEQQVNLTRFNLFFPEKREFFLEGRGIFDFARGSFRDRPQPAAGQRARRGRRADHLLQPAHRAAGQRGRADPRRRTPDRQGRRVRRGGPEHPDRRARHVRTGGETISGASATNFTVLRVKRDLLRRSSVGALLTNRSISRDGDRLEPGLGGGRQLLVLRQRQLPRLLRPDPHHRGDGPRRQLSGAVRLRSRPLRLRARPPGGGRRLPPRGRVPAARQLPAHVGLGPIQPAAAVDRIGPPVRPRGQPRLLPDRRRRTARDPPAAGRDADRAREQRPVRGEAERQLRVSAEAVHGLAERGRDDSGRRLRLHRRAPDLCARPATAAERAGGGRDRRLLRREAHLGRPQPRARRPVAAPVRRAQRLVQLDRFAGRRVPHRPRCAGA